MATIVDVTILGNRYKLKSSDNEAGQLEELAARLDARMQETASHLKRVNPLNVSILTALQLAEELAKSHGEARAAYAKLQKQYNDELARLGRQHAAELAQCKKDAAELEKKHSEELAKCKKDTAELEKNHLEEMAKLRQDMDRLEKKHADELAQCRAEQAAQGRKHADELAKLTDGQKESLSQLTRQHEALVAELRQAHSQEMAKVQQE
ncbi:MAG: cell division protein ZapA, partial [Selenomonadaceae bacterium]|nr:cell division protein ZapA [Selenomonadaceae bacterium]